MARFQRLAGAKIHMHSTRHARVKAPHYAHDVNPLEIIGHVLFEDGPTWHRILIGTRRAVNVARAGVPRRRRIRVIIGDFSIADNHVMREHAAYGLVEAAADRFLRRREFRPGPGSARPHFGERTLDKIKSRRRRIRLEVSPSAISLDGVAPPRDLPFKFGLRKHGSFRQIDLHAITCGLDVAYVDQTVERGRPETGERPAAAVKRQMFAGPFVAPAWRHDPGVLIAEIALLRLGNGGLIPGMELIDRMAERVSLDKFLRVIPALIKGAAEQNANAKIDLDQIVSDYLAVYDHARRDIHRPAPLGHVLIGVVAEFRVIP